MRAFLLSLLVVPVSLGQLLADNKPIERSAPVTVALEKALKKKYADMTPTELETVKELRLPHIHIKSFKDGDFAGLPNLKKLWFASLLHNGGKPTDPIAIGDKVFAHLSGLEELIMMEQLGLLPDDVFAGLESLKVLDLTYASLNRLPKSMLAMPKIEAVYFNGRGMDPADYETLKKQLGDKLKAKWTE